MSAQITKKFELAGSKPNYIPTKKFTIKHMKLELKPDFDEKSITCKQTLTMNAIQNGLDNIILDAAELNVRTVSANEQSLRFKTYDDKLRIELTTPASEDETITLSIDYDVKPRQGFYFVKPDKNYPSKQVQAWTQGEATQSKYWFPCFDHPDMKFTSEIIVKVPPDFVVISNGKLVDVTKTDLAQYNWIDEHPLPAYLKSVVIGKYEEIRETYNGIDLLYYVPKDKIETASLSFSNTIDMIKFFEGYIGVKYPYDKYSQAVVDDFIYGGMENASATTLTAETLHDRKAHLDFTSDHLVSHELAHQWFGDLVTCRDWQHIWLNESFATYFEGLSWLQSKGEDEFNYYIMQLAEEYFDEASKRYKRPLVTNVYKHPDDLFDRHTYEKGACTLHMLRNLVGDNIFRRAVKLYVERFSHKNAETDDFRKCIEEVSGVSLQQFFEQYVFKPGHLELKVEFEFNHSSHIATLKLTQIQNTDDGTPIYSFPLDIHLATEHDKRQLSFIIDSKEPVFHIPLDSEPTWFSIDPGNKLLKRVEVKAPKQMLIDQLNNGNTVERIYAAKALSNFSSDDVIESLKEAMLTDSFWGVSSQCAKALSDIKTEAAFNALIDALKLKNPKARRAVVKAIGEFKKQESVSLLRQVLDNDESYFVQAESAISLGKSTSKEVFATLLKALRIRSFNEVIASGALTGLGELKDDIASHVLIEYSKLGKNHRIREAAALALGKFAKGNDKIIDYLKQLLKDPWFKVRINAVKAFVEAQESKGIQDIELVAKNDIDPRVRRVAEESVLAIRESMQTPKEVTQMREDVDKLKSKNLELVQRLDRLERELK
ncbi:MAG: M1 family aminopeptidase [Nitrososphaerales archaeon]